MVGMEGYTSTTSPVDILFPSMKRHPNFNNVKAQVAVLKAGEALVLPSGWWRYAVALEPSVTLHHPFWNLENRQHMTGEIRDTFDWDTMLPEEAEGYMAELKIIQEEIMEDSDCEAES